MHHWPEFGRIVRHRSAGKQPDPFCIADQSVAFASFAVEGPGPMAFGIFQIMRLIEDHQIRHICPDGMFKTGTDRLIIGFDDGFTTVVPLLQFSPPVGPGNCGADDHQFFCTNDSCCNDGLDGFTQTHLIGKKCMPPHGQE